MPYRLIFSANKFNGICEITIQTENFQITKVATMIEIVTLITDI